MKERDLFLVGYGILIGIAALDGVMALLDGTVGPAAVMALVILFDAWRISVVASWNS